MKVPLILLFYLTLHTPGPVQTIHPYNKADCALEASELGPDWYKVPQPIPTAYAEAPDYVRSFIHMPCAATTVFDVAICGCTNLMSFLYSAVEGHNGGKSRSSHHVNITAPPGDFVKTTEPPKPTPAGSILLNLKTGEIRQCPFRASSRGLGWYLMHEPTDTWRPMRCAPGTLFHKKHCTCVHEGTFNSEELKAEDANILVLEDEQNTNTRQSNTISKALGINMSDVDFGSDTQSKVPQWRRETTQPQATHPNKQPVQKPEKPTSSLRVSTFNGQSGTDNANVTLGKDAISDEHRKRLLRKGPIPLIQKEAPALAIDSTIDKHVQKINVVNMDSNADLLALDEMIETMKKEKTSQGSKAFVGQDSADHVIVFAHKECSKKPIPELGPQFFQLYIWGFGLVPYICNGDRMYDHNKCACVLAPRDATFDEVHFPVTDCQKRAAPELGPRYFQMYQWGIGFTPYRCHQHFVFKHQQCACVKP